VLHNICILRGGSYDDGSDDYDDDAAEVLEAVVDYLAGLSVISNVLKVHFRHVFIYIYFNKVSVPM